MKEERFQPRIIVIDQKGANEGNCLFVDSDEEEGLRAARILLEIVSPVWVNLGIANMGFEDWVEENAIEFGFWEGNPSREERIWRKFW